MDQGSVGGVAQKRGMSWAAIVLLVVVGVLVVGFGGCVLCLGGAFAILGREQPAQPSRPRWSVGQTVDVEVTLVKNDRRDLACASSEEVAGRHCAFEAKGTPWSKGESTDDRKVLRPYVTSERLQLTAAGLWSEPALAPEKLPATRFRARCKYEVEGTLGDLGVRWEEGGQWFPNHKWYAGSLSGCVLVP
jgi:hypothetical protein